MLLESAAPDVKSFQLYATDGYMTLPDGEQIYIWGYSLKNEQGSAVFTSPTLEVNEGDRVALVPVESAEYQRFVEGGHGNVIVLPGMRNSKK